MLSPPMNRAMNKTLLIKSNNDERAKYIRFGSAKKMIKRYVYANLLFIEFLLFSHNKIEQKLEKMQIVIKQHFQ